MPAKFAGNAQLRPRRCTKSARGAEFMLTCAEGGEACCCGIDMLLPDCEAVAAEFGPLDFWLLFPIPLAEGLCWVAFAACEVSPCASDGGPPD